MFNARIIENISITQQFRRDIMATFRADEENNGDLKDGGNYWDNYRKELSERDVDPAVRELLRKLVDYGEVEVPAEMVEAFENFYMFVDGWDEDGPDFALKPIMAV